jgi:hypothetical protein
MTARLLFLALLVALLALVCVEAKSESDTLRDAKTILQKAVKQARHSTKAKKILGRAFDNAHKLVRKLPEVQRVKVSKNIRHFLRKLSKKLNKHCRNALKRANRAFSAKRFRKALKKAQCALRRARKTINKAIVRPSTITKLLAKRSTNNAFKAVRKLNRIFKHVKQSIQEKYTTKVDAIRTALQSLVGKNVPTPTSNSTLTKAVNAATAVAPVEKQSIIAATMKQVAIATDALKAARVTGNQEAITTAAENLRVIAAKYQNEMKQLPSSDARAGLYEAMRKITHRKADAKVLSVNAVQTLMNKAVATGDEELLKKAKKHARATQARVAKNMVIRAKNVDTKLGRKAKNLRMKAKEARAAGEINAAKTLTAKAKKTEKKHKKASSAAKKAKKNYTSISQRQQSQLMQSSLMDQCQQKCSSK